MFCRSPSHTNPPVIRPFSFSVYLEHSYLDHLSNLCVASISHQCSPILHATMKMLKKKSHLCSFAAPALLLYKLTSFNASIFPFNTTWWHLYFKHLLTHHRVLPLISISPSLTDNPLYDIPSHALQRRDRGELLHFCISIVCRSGCLTKHISHLSGQGQWWSFSEY